MNQPADIGRIMEQRIDAVFQHAPIVQHLGIQLQQLQTGWCKTRMAVGEQHLQHLGVVHGGVLGIFAGHTALAAAMSLDEQESTFVAPDFNISIMRSASEGVLVAEAQVLSSGRKTVFVRVDIRQGKTAGGHLLASGRFTLSRIRKSKP